MKKLLLLIGILILALGCSSEPEIVHKKIITTATHLPKATFTPIPQVSNTSIIQIDIPEYNRSDWKHWIDEDRDCQNTRHEVLIDESIGEIKFKDDKECQVLEGIWSDPFTGNEFNDASSLDIDHMVPLKNAHISGGWAWGKSKKSSYANSLSNTNHLIAVSLSANRSKGARAPDEWKPTNREYWCEYANIWIEIKTNWGLTITQAESNALNEMLNTCN